MKNYTGHLQWKSTMGIYGLYLFSDDLGFHVDINLILSHQTWDFSDVTIKHSEHMGDLFDWNVMGTHDAEQ